MAAISVRNLDERVKDLLRIRAARHGRSMESEIRVILEDAVRPPSERPDLFRAVIERFGGMGGVDLVLPERSTATRSADFDT